MSDCSATDVAATGEEVLLSHVLFGHSSLLLPLLGIAEGSLHEVAAAAARCRCYHHFPLDGEYLRNLYLHSS